MAKPVIRRNREEIQSHLGIPTYVNGATRCQQSHYHICSMWCKRQQNESKWNVKVDQILMLCESPMVKENRAYRPNYDGMAPEQHRLFTKAIRHSIERHSSHKLPVLPASQSDTRRFARPTVASQNRSWMSRVIEIKMEELIDNKDRRSSAKKDRPNGRALHLEKTHGNDSFSAWDLKQILAALSARSNEASGPEQHQSTRSGSLKSGTNVSKNVHNQMSSEKIRQILRKDIHGRTREDIQVIFKALRPLKAFEKLADVLLIELCSVVALQEYSQDKIIFKQGETGSTWYVILSGSVDVMVMNKAVADYHDTDSQSLLGKDLHSIEAQKLRRECQFVVRLGSGQGFGELALINDSKRGASIIAHEPSQLLCIEKRDYNRILRFLHDQEHKEKDMYIRKIPILEGIEEINIFSMANIVRLKALPAGEFVCKEGTLLNEVGFICKGSCIVTKELRFEDPNTKQMMKKMVTLGTLVQGDYFGELAMKQVTKDIKPMASLITIQTLEDTTVMAMTLADARMKLGQLLVTSTISEISTDQSRLLEKYIENCEEKEWNRFRKKMVDGMIKERFHDPNLTNDKYQAQLAHKLPSFKTK